MTTGSPSTLARAMTWMVVVLAPLLLLAGIYQYGWSMEVHQRFWSDIFERLHGPMTFRFYLQPTMAAIAALTDGIGDARHGHKFFIWSAHDDPTRQAGRLREGIMSTARIVLLGLSMDVIYQFKVLDHFYPAEALVMAIALAVVPYFILRWVVEQVAGWWLNDRRNSPS